MRRRSSIKKFVKIGQAAKILGVSADTLRRWEEKGKLSPFKTLGNTRLYSLESVKKLSGRLNNTDQDPLLSIPVIIPQIKKQTSFQKENLFAKFKEVTKITHLVPLSGAARLTAVLFIVFFLILGGGSYFSISQISQDLTADEKQSLTAPFENVLGEQTVSDPLLASGNVSFNIPARFNDSVLFKKDISAEGNINGLLISSSDSGIKITDPVNNRSLSITGADVVLNQSLATSSSPDLSSLNLTATSKQIVVGPKGGITGTLTWTPTSSNKTITLQDKTTTLVGQNTTDTLSNKTIKSGDSNTISGSFTDITGLGTITTGTWNGTKIGIGYGGTNLTSYTKGDILYSSASDTLAKLAIGSGGQVLSISSGIPAWATLGASGITADSLDFTELADSLTLDANLSISSSASNYSIDIDSGTLFVDTTNNRVGIGTTTANSTLSVAGNAHIGSLYQGTSAPANGLFVDGNVGIGATTSSNKLDVWGGARIAGTLTADSTGTLGNALIGYSGVTAPSNGLAVYGNVGIGTTSPAYNLDVAGSANITGSLTVSGSIVGSGAVGGWTRDSTNGYLYASTITDKVGIGTTGPSSQLEVKASANPALSLYAASSGTSNIFQVLNNAGTSTYFSIDSSGSLSGSAFQITDASNAVVGTAIAGGWTMSGNTYTYRRTITVTNSSGSTMPSNYQISISLSSADSNQVYSKSQQSSPYYDFRIAYGGTPADIARNVSSFTSSSVAFTFQTQAAITNGSSDTYYIYYGNSSLSSTPSTYTGDIDTWEGFETASGWTSGDTAFIASDNSSSPSSQQGTNSMKMVAMVDRMGVGTTASQTQLSANLYKQAGILTTIGSTQYIYLVGGHNGTSDQSTISKAALSSDNVGSWSTTGTSQPAVSNTSVNTVSAVNGGSGNDGAVTFSSNTNINTANTITGRSCADGGDAVNYATTTNISAGATTITLSSTPASGCLAANDEILIIDQNGTNDATTSTSETATISSISTNTLTLSAALTNAYSGSTRKVMVQRVPNYTTVTVNNGVTLNATGRSNSTGKGGIVFFRATGNVTINGTISLVELGYSSSNLYSNGIGPGGGTANSSHGGGGGYGGAGGNSGWPGGGTGGGTYGSATSLDLGSEGGGSNISGSQRDGRGGGGLVYITTTGSVTNNGTISANGGSDSTFKSGGGSGGKIIVLAASTITNSGSITANGGTGGPTSSGGGGGGGGRISFNSSVSGTITASGGAGGDSGAAGTDGVISYSVSSPNLYILGGITGSTAQSAIYKAAIDSSGNIGTFSATTQGLPAALYGHTSIADSSTGTGYIYIIGGQTGSSTPVSTVYRATVTSTGDITSAPTTSGQGQLGVNLTEHATTTISIGGTTYVYAVGGTTTGAAAGAVATIYKASISSGNISSWSALTSLPAARYGAQVAAATVGSVNYLYIFGGKDSSGNESSTIYRATLDSSGDITAITATAQGTLTEGLSDHITLSNASGGSTYFYTLGGYDGSAANTTVYRSTLTSDMTNFTLTKTVTSVDLSNKNDLQFKWYSNSTASDLMQIAFSEDGSTWQTTTFTASSASTWETKTWDISAIAASSRNAVTQLRVKINSAPTTEVTSYIDDLDALLEATTYTNSTSNGRAILGANNLAINAQGTGLVQINYASGATAAGSGGFAVYDGTTNALFTVAGSGNVGIGTTGPAKLNIIGSGTGTALTLLTTSSTGTQNLAVLDNGNVGIGTTNPLSSFYVTGNAMIGYSSGAPSSLANGLAVSGNVGIGTTNPGAKLTVIGNIGIGTSSAGSSLSVNGNGVFGWGTASIAGPTNGLAVQGNVGIGTTSPSELLHVQGSGSMPSLLVTSAGNVGIGTSVTSYPLTVGIDGSTGNGAYLSAGGTWTSGSSREFKENFTLLNPQLILNKINSLPVMQWNYKLEEESVKHIGPIAEDFYSIFGLGNDNKHISTIDPAGIALIGVQALSSKLDNLEVSLNNLQAKIASLSANNNPGLDQDKPGLKESTTTSSSVILTRFDESETRRASPESTSSATDSGVVSFDFAQDPPQNDSTLNLTPPDILLATGSATLTTGASAQLVDLTVTSDATISGQLTAYDLNIQNSLKSFGNTTLGTTLVAGDLTVDGTMSLTGSSINVSGVLSIQNSPLAESLNLFNGLITIDKEGNIVSSGQITVSKINLTQSAGRSTLSAGQNKIVIKNQLVEEDSLIFLTPTSLTDYILAVTQKVKGESFTVEIKSPSSNDIEFNWWVVN